MIIVRNILLIVAFVAILFLGGSAMWTNASHRGALSEQTASVSSVAGKPKKTSAADAPGHRMELRQVGLLTFYFPKYQRIDLVCGTMPSAQNTKVLFCCEAAFTGRERLTASEFKHKFIAGNHVSGGKCFKGYACRANTGCFAYYADSGRWQFAYKNYAGCLDKAVRQHGMAFGQTMIIYNGLDVHNGRPCKDSSVNQYRALCELNGRLCIAEASKNMSYKEFVTALKNAGVKHALYLDMGRGWNYSFYRNNKGELRYIHNERIPYTTNWITFYSE